MAEVFCSHIARLRTCSGYAIFLRHLAHLSVGHSFEAQRLVSAKWRIYNLGCQHFLQQQRNNLELHFLNADRHLEGFDGSFKTSSLLHVAGCNHIDTHCFGHHCHIPSWRAKISAIVLQSAQARADHTKRHANLPKSASHFADKQKFHLLDLGFGVAAWNFQRIFYFN